MTQRYNLYTVGVLQDYGEPFVSLYVDINDNSLFLSLRTMETMSLSYVLLPVTPAVIQQYMHEQLSVRSIISASPKVLSRRKAGKCWEICEISAQTAQQSIDDDWGVYEPELCIDKRKIEKYLKTL